MTAGIRSNKMKMTRHSSRRATFRLDGHRLPSLYRATIRSGNGFRMVKISSPKAKSAGEDASGGDI
jgi:hypothetical protein